MKSTSELQTARPPRRRWLRFSLRTVLVVVTVLGVWLGVQVNRARKQREALAWVEQIGGEAVYDYEIPDDDWTKRRTNVKPPPGPKWLREYLGIDFFDEVVWVHIHDPAVSNLTPLAELTSLQWKSTKLRPTSCSTVMPKMAGRLLASLLARRS